MPSIYNYNKKDGTSRLIFVDESKSKPILSTKYHSVEDKNEWNNCKTTTEIVCTHIVVWDIKKCEWRKLILSNIKDKFEAKHFLGHLYFSSIDGEQKDFKNYMEHLDI